MPDKTLRSLKFPGLSGTYHIPQLAAEYDEDRDYYYGNFVTYEGDLYRCTYVQFNPDQPDYITGEFNSDYWVKSDIDYNSFASYVSETLNYDFIEPYDVEGDYNVGSVAKYRDQIYYCIKEPSHPVGSFDDTFWWNVSDVPTMGLIGSPLSSLSQKIDYLTIMSQQINVSNVISLSTNQQTWTPRGQQDQDQGLFEYATCELSIDPDYDYLVLFPGSFGFHNILIQAANQDDITYPDESDVNPLFDYRYHGLQVVDAYNYIQANLGSDEVSDGFVGYCHKIIQSRFYEFLNPTDQYDIDSIVIAVTGTMRQSEIDPSTHDFVQHTELINQEELESITSNLQLIQLKPSNSLDMPELSKIVLQDYTEVYKSLSDQIVSYDDSKQYTDSVEIPLNEGNIALQFINFNNAWNDIDIELRVYSDKFGTNQSIKISDSEKSVYVINRDIGQNGQMIEWDYCKLRFRSDDTYLTQDEVNFVNTTLNILRKPKTQSSPNPVNKNDPIAVQQFLNLAKSFQKAEACYNINQPTFLETSCYYQPGSNIPYNIDASTFIHSCLRGLSFENTPYAIDWQLPPSYDQQFGSLINAINWKANTNLYSWAINSYEDLSYRWSIYSNQFTHTEELENSSEQDATSIFNECGALAKWMVDKGWRIDTVSNLKEDIKLQNIQPGDILFFAEQMGISGMFKFFVADMFPGYNYRNITHAGIVTEVKLIDDLVGSDVPYQYQIKMISTPSILQNYLRQTSGHFEYDYTMEDILQNRNVYTNTNNLSHFMPAIDTFVMACRPDLASHKKSYLEFEAEKLGLHVVPENNDQLEIIKKCRACSDIEWSPSRNYDRPMPLTGNTCWPLDPDFSLFIDGQFTSGVTYKGLPWSPQSTILNPEAFLSIIENENCPVYEDSSGTYPYYGWSDPRDFVNFIFGNIKFSLDQLPLPFGADSNFFDLEKIQLGQVIRRPAGMSLNQDHYAAVITDYSYDELGNVNMIEVTEATRYGLVNPNDSSGQYGNLIRRKTFNLSEFLNWYGLETEISGSIS